MVFNLFHQSLKLPLSKWDYFSVKQQPSGISVIKDNNNDKKLLFLNISLSYGVKGRRNILQITICLLTIHTYQPVSSREPKRLGFISCTWESLCCLTATHPWCLFMGTTKCSSPLGTAWKSRERAGRAFPGCWSTKHLSFKGVCATTFLKDTSLQEAAGMLISCSAVCGTPLNRILCQTQESGGGFIGIKDKPSLLLSPEIHCLCSRLAWTLRTVRVMLLWQSNPALKGNWLFSKQGNN